MYIYGVLLYQQVRERDTMKIIGFYDIYDATPEGHEDFAWDQVLCLCEPCAEKVLAKWDTKELETVQGGECDGCRK